jgi:hypothetical protein
MKQVVDVYELIGKEDESIFLSKITQSACLVIVPR